MSETETKPKTVKKTETAIKLRDRDILRDICNTETETNLEIKTEIPWVIARIARAGSRRN